VKDWHERRDCFSDRLQKIAKRIDSRGSAERMAKIVVSDSHLLLTSWAPNVRAYICWTGGYVKPFLDRLTEYMPLPRYQLIPMYSMSTETVETLTCFHDRKASFLPIAKHVLYEFIEAGNADEPSNLLRPAELETGKSYSMVVSDAFGLRRYQTDDLFRCDGMTLRLPNLSFLRRRQLEYSFTGEKLTAEQLTTVFQKLRLQYPVLFRETFLTCIPCQPRGERLPHYRILAVGTSRIAVPDFSEECERHLCQLNVEYRSKRLSGRLGALTFANITTAEFTQHITESAHSRLETQFKFLPLYREVWHA
jgi:GH3 auxin-responsive promoter